MLYIDTLGTAFSFKRVRFCFGKDCTIVKLSQIFATIHLAFGMFFCLILNF